MARARTTALKAFLWGGAVAAVLAVGIVWFPREEPGLGFWESLYYTLRLFIFEHDLGHFPRAWPLRAVHFLAPLIALSAVGTFVSYLFHLSPAVKSRFFRGHVVVCGMGRTGKLLTRALIQKGSSVVGVDRAHPADPEHFRDEISVPLVLGDFHDSRSLVKAGAPRARALVFASGDDLSNLESALAAYEFLSRTGGGVRVILAHIANERLAGTARRALATSGPLEIRFFDTYRIAAKRMLSAHFNREARKGVGRVTVMGFGKFGGDLTEVLLKDRDPEECWDLVVVDKEDLEGRVMALARDLDFDEIAFVRSGVEELSADSLSGDAFFLCTDDDVGNLTAAMALAAKTKGRGRLFVRMARWPLPAVSERLGDGEGVVFVNLNDLMMQGFSELPGILEPEKNSRA